MKNLNDIAEDLMRVRAILEQLPETEEVIDAYDLLDEAAHDLCSHLGHDFSYMAAKYRKRSAA